MRASTPRVPSADEELLRDSRHARAQAQELRQESARSRSDLRAAVSELRKHVVALNAGMVRAPGAPAETLSAELTAREVQVLSLIGQGLRAKEIAARLNIAVKTVVCHKTNIMDKLEIRD